MRKKPPTAVWVAVVALIVITVIQLAVGLWQGNLRFFVSAPLNLLLAFGLYAGHKWAYVLTLLSAIVAPVVLLRSLGVLVLNGVIYVPVLMATRYYWPTRGAQPKPLVCPNCGYNLLGLTVPRCPECGSVFEI